MLQEIIRKRYPENQSNVVQLNGCAGGQVIL